MGVFDMGLTCDFYDCKFSHKPRLAVFWVLAPGALRKEPRPMCAPHAQQLAEGLKAKVFPIVEKGEDPEAALWN